QMLHASDLVEAVPAGGARERALDHLLAGQSNDPYWHGLFGGIYLPDLRVANLSRLIAAEDIALTGRPSESGVLRDVDLDGLLEVVLANDGEFVSVKLDDGAGIGRWDLRAVRFPLGAVLRRRRPRRPLRGRLAGDRSDAGPPRRDPRRPRTGGRSRAPGQRREDDRDRRRPARSDPVRRRAGDQRGLIAVRGADRARVVDD